MFCKSLGLALGVAVVALGGCGVNTRGDAAKGVAAFLKAAHDGDRAGFDAAIDHPAVRADLRRQLVAMAEADILEVEGGPSDFALDRMVAPDALHMPAQAPDAGQVSAMLNVQDRKHVCLRDAANHCLLTFAKEDKGAWKLVGMQATNIQIIVPAQPGKP